MCVPSIHVKGYIARTCRNDASYDVLYNMCVITADESVCIKWMMGCSFPAPIDIVILVAFDSPQSSTSRSSTSC